MDISAKNFLLLYATSFMLFSFIYDWGLSSYWIFENANEHESFALMMIIMVLYVENQIDKRVENA